jgi:Holliday junction resolvasome RuvABC endonuclease subunit
MHVDAIIVGIDLATARGKLIAMVIVHFQGDGVRKVIYASRRRISRRNIYNRIQEWLEVFEATLAKARRCGGPDMVAIEDARPRGRGGAHMQYLFRVLKDHALTRGYRVAGINPATVKKHATGRGLAATEQIATLVRAEYKMNGIPIVAGEYDLEMATAIAGAGYAILQEEALLAQANA